MSAPKAIYSVLRRDDCNGAYSAHFRTACKIACLEYRNNGPDHISAYVLKWQHDIDAIGLDGVAPEAAHE